MYSLWLRVFQVAVLPEEVAERHQTAAGSNAELLGTAELQEECEMIGHQVARIAHADDGRHQISVLPRLVDELLQRMVHISQVHRTMLFHRLQSMRLKGRHRSCKGCILKKSHTLKPETLLGGFFHAAHERSKLLLRLLCVLLCRKVAVFPFQFPLISF